MLGALTLLAMAQTSSPKWVLTFDQSFTGKAGTAPDPKVWARDLGGGGYGNNELETYTDGNKNAFLDGNGNLVIEARKEGSGYTSARLKTQGLYTQRYGKIVARMKLPQGAGMWPAFWMLGASIATKGWPDCGEIDVVENIGREPTLAHGTMHGPGYSGADGIGNSTTSGTLSSAFHEYAVEWSPKKAVWTFDGKPYHTVTADGVGTKPWPFERPFFLLLNLAVGGGWPGNPDGTTVFPQRLTIDYVRTYQDANLKVDEVALGNDHSVRQYGKHAYVYPGPFAVPGSVPAADYLPGAETGYHDEDYVNEGYVKGGSNYRYDGVDVQRSNLSDTPFDVGWTHAGEWLAYTVTVGRTGYYDLSANVASDGAGGNVSAWFDGKALAGGRIPDTGGWSTWRRIPLGRVYLQAGRRTMRLQMDSNGTKTNSTGNVASCGSTASEGHSRRHKAYESA